MDWLEKEIELSNTKDPLFSLDKVKEKYTIKSINNNCWLVLNFIEEHWLKFAILEFYSSKVDETDIKTIVLFHGEGSTGLRECRHTWWGKEGYIFYPNGKNIAESLMALSEFFDGMV